MESLICSLVQVVSGQTPISANVLVNNPFINPSTTVFDVTNPDYPINVATLDGMEQVSAAYDPGKH